jgi:hypothetical protein
MLKACGSAGEDIPFRAIASSDVELVESIRFGDRLGEWVQGCR